MAKPNANGTEPRSPAPETAEQASETRGWTALRFDIDEFRKFVADLGMTEAQETAYLQALWEIAVAVVDLKFKVHPAQQVTEKETLVVDSGAVLRSVITSKQISKESRAD